MNLLGEVKSEPQFYTDSDLSFYYGKFSDGMLQVRTGPTGPFGFVNEFGELQIPCQYKIAHPFQNGVAKVRTDSNENFFYINRRGDVVSLIHDHESLKLNTQFDEVGTFSEGLALARNGECWGVIDEKFEIKIPFKYKMLKHKYRDVHKFIADGIYLASGDYINDESPRFSSGLIAILEVKRATTINKSKINDIFLGYMDSNEKITIPTRFEIGESFKFPK
jgi:hypothetical protein